MGKRKPSRKQALADGRRDYLAHMERRGRVALERRGLNPMTPPWWQFRDPLPWYLPELGLRRDPFTTRYPAGEPVPVIRCSR